MPDLRSQLGEQTGAAAEEVLRIAGIEKHIIEGILNGVARAVRSRHKAKQFIAAVGRLVAASIREHAPWVIRGVGSWAASSYAKSHTKQLLESVDD